MKRKTALNFSWAPTGPDAKGYFQKLLSAPVTDYTLQGNKLYKLEMKAMGRPRTGGCTFGGLLGRKRTINILLNDVPFELSSFDCSQAEIASGKPLDQLVCTRTNFKKVEERSGLTMRVALELGDDPQNTSLGQNAIPAKLYRITKGRIMRSNIESAPWDVYGVRDSRSWLTLAPAGEQSNQVKTVSKLRQYRRVADDVLSAYASPSSYTETKLPRVTKTSVDVGRIKGEYDLFGQSYLSVNPSNPTWASEVASYYAANVTPETERRMMEALDWMAKSCPGTITNAEIVRTGLNATGGDSPLVMLASHNLSKAFASWSRGVALREKKGIIYPDDTYWTQRMERVWSKMERLEDDPMLVLSDPFGPFYHFHGGFSAGAFGFMPLTYLEALVFDLPGMGRQPNMVQNLSGIYGGLGGFIYETLVAGNDVPQGPGSRVAGLSGPRIERLADQMLKKLQNR